MKNIYLLLFACLSFFFSGCSKDLLKRYERRIIGTWELYDIDRRGFGGSISNQEFQPGTFTFREDGTVTYVLDGVTYNGGWDIDRYTRTTNCNGEDGCSNQLMHSLFISVTEPTSQYTRTESFTDMNFTSTNRFNAFDEADFKTYIFRFRRL